MAVPPQANLDINALRESIFRLPRPHGDPIDMEHVLQIDKGLAVRIMAQRVALEADLHRVAAEHMQQASALFK